jgi:hypothetical protein
MIEFKGYIEYSIDPRTNDKQNIVEFLKDCINLYKNFIPQTKDGEYPLDFISKDFTSYYSNFNIDLKKTISETIELSIIEIENIERNIYEFDENPWRKTSYSKLRNVGLTGKSLETKLNTNRAIWAKVQSKNNGVFNFKKESDRTDAKALLDYVKSILGSLIKGWGFGEIGKELLDLFSIILNRIISL